MGETRQRKVKNNAPEKPKRKKKPESAKNLYMAGLAVTVVALLGLFWNSFQPSEVTIAKQTQGRNRILIHRFICGTSQLDLILHYLPIFHSDEEILSTSWKSIVPTNIQRRNKLRIVHRRSAGDLFWTVCSTNARSRYFAD